MCWCERPWGQVPRLRRAKVPVPLFNVLIETTCAYIEFIFLIISLSLAICPNVKEPSTDLLCTARHFKQILTCLYNCILAKRSARRSVWNRVYLSNWRSNNCSDSCYQTNSSIGTFQIPPFPEILYLSSEQKNDAYSTIPRASYGVEFTILTGG